ncbi:MAG: carboxymuconolactone decarboxylase family protein [Gemmatimonadota bacterium]|nr:MAG: carboxymuconolactone decarboxylase family protein [Gemmatimonadota bacterium]
MTAADWVWDLVDLAAAQAAGDAGGLDAAFESLHAAGRESEVEEAILQSYLFLGFPSAIEAFRRWRTHGVAAPEAAAEGSEAWVERGEATCATVYGDHYESLRENIARFHPELDRWMVMEGYGKVLSRPALSLEVREMLIVAMLVVQGESGRRQLRSHLQGALNAGVAPADVERTVRRAATFAPPENRELALMLWAAVRDA